MVERYATITMEGAVCRVAFPYDGGGRLVMRTLRARWNPAEKVWTLPAALAPVARARLSDIGFAFIIDDDFAGAATVLRHARDDARKSYWALSKAFHPDHGDSNAAMKAVNAAWEQAS